jgi:hypothetical protein
VRNPQRVHAAAFPHQNSAWLARMLIALAGAANGGPGGVGLRSGHAPWAAALGPTCPAAQQSPTVERGSDSGRGTQITRQGRGVLQAAHIALGADPPVGGVGGLSPGLMSLPGLPREVLQQAPSPPPTSLTIKMHGRPRFLREAGRGLQARGAVRVPVGHTAQRSGGLENIR